MKVEVEASVVVKVEVEASVSTTRLFLKTALSSHTVHQSAFFF